MFSTFFVMMISLAGSPLSPATIPSSIEDDATQSNAQWSQWRGPTRDGQYHGDPWPATLKGTLNESWRIDGLGPSYCGPIITEDRIFTAETRDEKYEVVQAYHRPSGAKLWETSWEGAMSVPFFAANNGSWIRSTPSWDGERLYVAGMNDVLVCLDGATGKQRWRVDFVQQFNAPPPEFGFVCSPLVTDAHVYVQAGGSFCKLDKFTGEIIWRSLEDGGGMMGSAFSSPILSELNGKQQLIVLGREKLHGVDPDSGSVLWTLPIKSFRGMNILTPIVWNDRVFTAPYGGKAQLISVGASDHAAAQPTPEWQNSIQGYMTSPVIVDGHAYIFTRSNRFACIRLEDGETTFVSPPTGDKYWSLVAQDDRILALSDSGVLRLIRANPEQFDIIDDVQIVNAPTWAHVSIAGRDLVIRSQDALIAYEWSDVAQGEPVVLKKSRNGEEAGK